MPLRKLYTANPLNPIPFRHFDGIYGRLVPMTHSRTTLYSGGSPQHTKVDDLDCLSTLLTIRSQAEICKLHVSMHNVVLVQP